MLCTVTLILIFSIIGMSGLDSVDVSDLLNERSWVNNVDAINQLISKISYYSEKGDFPNVYCKYCKFEECECICEQDIPECVCHCFL